MRARSPGIASAFTGCIGMDIQTFLLEQSRPTGGQLRRVWRALAAYAMQAESATQKDLASAAGVPGNLAKGVCAQLEQLGIVELRFARWSVTADIDELDEAVEDLAIRFEIPTLRRRGRR